MTVACPYGQDGLLVECADPLALAAALRGQSGVVDVVPGACTVLVTGQGARAAVDALDLTALPAAAGAAADVVEIPVVYDGADLEAVASECGLSVEALVTMHSTASYLVAFTGFAPGFGYLRGLPAPLHVPRLPTPRPEVPAGSVAIAGEYSGVYPTASPGGWRLLGRTDVVLFDVARDPPGLLAPGTRVRFVAA